jgi:hypothetical protein
METPSKEKPVITPVEKAELLKTIKEKTKEKIIQK